MSESYCFVTSNGVDLCAEHDAGEKGEEKSFKDAKQGEDEGQRARHDAIAAVKVLAHTAEEEHGRHSKPKH